MGTWGRIVNEANQITKATALFGFIAEAAQQNRFAVTLNRRFKAAGDDAMMIPMNIRPDDFYFTLSNMKRSHVRGALIGFDYQSQALEIVDSAAGLCERTGLCDTVMIKEEIMHGELLFPTALKTMIERSRVHTIALLGATPLAGACAAVLDGYNIAIFDPWIESVVALQDRLGLEVDINRLAPGMTIDMRAYDMLIDFSEMDDFSMITALPKYNVDFCQPREASALRDRCTALDAAYSGYESLLDTLSETAYIYLTKEL